MVRMQIVALLIVGLLTQKGYGLTAEELAAFNDVVAITDNENGTLTFVASGMPDHEYDDSVNPNNAFAQNYSFVIASSPIHVSDGMRHCTDLGPIGMATNGVAIYNALTGFATDAVVNEVLDSCQGHASPTGAYHYHEFPSCIGNIEAEDEFLGVAMDGHPIYGPKASDRTEPLKSADLDECHGRLVNGVYRYHITTDFPYALGCYVSKPAEISRSGPPSGGRGPPFGEGGRDGGQPRPNDMRNSETETSCENTDGGAQLCDCKSTRTYVACDVVIAGGDCDGDGESDNPDEIIVPRDPPVNGAGGDGGDGGGSDNDDNGNSGHRVVSSVMVVISVGIMHATLL